MSRYERQRRVGSNGAGADDRLAALRVLLVGAGGIGAPLAIGLVRAGVGHLRIVDPDVVAETDLPRQPLYFPEDARAGRPKVEAALTELARIGGRTRLEGSAVALTPRDSRSLIGEVDLVVDATDHLPAREWIDDACGELGVPWIHTAAIGDSYRVIPFLSPGPPCFRCYLPEPPPLDILGTCESAGVLPVATALAAAHAIAVLWAWLAGRDGDDESVPGTRRVLVGRVGTAPRELRLRRDPACPVCAGERPVFASGLRLLCGKRRAEGWVRLGAAELRSRFADGSVAAERGWRIREVVGGLRVERGDEVILLGTDGRLLYGPAEDLASARARLIEVLGPDALGG